MAKYNRKNTESKVQPVFGDHCGVISHGTKSWSTQVNFVDWGRGIVLDVRPWNYDRTNGGKGLTLNREEAIRLRDILIKLDLGEVEPLPYPEAPLELEPTSFDNGWG